LQGKSTKKSRKKYKKTVTKKERKETSKDIYFHQLIWIEEGKTTERASINQKERQSEKKKERRVDIKENTETAHICINLIECYRFTVRVHA
jgi:hypothetical protein